MKRSILWALVFSLSFVCLAYAQTTASAARLYNGDGALGSVADVRSGFGTVGVANSPNGLASLVLYDNFNSKLIDPAKWDGEQNYDPDIREATREVTVSAFFGGRLHLSHRVYSAVTDNFGSSGGLWGLSFPKPSAVTAVSFALAVNKLDVTACTSNPGVGGVAAEFRGNFFNTQSSPTSSIGDVVADIGVQRSVTDVGSALTVVGFVTECADQFCGSQTVLAYQVLGTVNAGTTNTLYLQWDQPNHQFIFRLNNDSPVYEAYGVADSSPPFFGQKGIDLARGVAHCTTTPRPYASVDAYFDNVYVNP